MRGRLPSQVLGAIRLARQRPEQALQALETARSLAPSDYLPNLFMAITLTQLGRPLEGLGHLEKGLRLNPRISGGSAFSNLMAGIYSVTGRMDEAVALWQRAREANPDLIMPRLSLADHHVRTGDLSEARALVQEALQVQPALTADHIFERSRGPRTVDRESFRRNLRSAGLP